jgi:drug/metabolite transporter (DMT)-like permease
LIFKENLTAYKIIGVLLILIGNIIIVFGAKFNKTYSKMILLRVLVCVLIAAANMLDAYNGKNFPLSFYMFFGYFGGGIIAYFLSKVSINKIKSQLKQNLIGQLLMGILAALGYFCFLQAFNYAEKSIVIPISYVNSILLVILGIVFLKERKFLWKKIIAIIVVFLGSVFVNL